MGMYEELVNRWVRMSGTTEPNTESGLNLAPIGSAYAKLGADPVIPYIKNRVGANGWDQFVGGSILGRTIYADAGYTGVVENGSESSPFKTVQAAVDYAASLNPDYTNPTYILLKGYFAVTTEVLVRSDGINIATDGYAEITNVSGLYALVYTNATAASWAAYKAGGYSNYALLVNQGDYGPYYATLEGLTCSDYVGFFGVKGDFSPNETEFLGYGMAVRSLQGNPRIRAHTAGAVEFTFCDNIHSSIAYEVSVFSVNFSRQSNLSTFSFDNSSVYGIPAWNFAQRGTFRAIGSFVGGLSLLLDVYLEGRGTAFSGTITADDTGGLGLAGGQLIDCSVAGNITLNGTAKINSIDSSALGGNLTLAAGNTSTTNLRKGTQVAGTITDPLGSITYNDKWMFTPFGGRATLFQNNSGGTLAKGTVVKGSTANDDSVIVTALSDTTVRGVVFMDILSTKWGWVVTEGPAETLVDNAGATTRGDWIGTSAANTGRGTAQAAPPADATRDKQIGFAMRSRAGVGLVLANISTR